MDFRHPVTALIPGVQGRLLEVLAQSTAELSLRTLARLAGVSAAQASRVLPHLVHQGLVERREVPPSSLFTLNRDHVVAGLLLQLSNARHQAINALRQLTKQVEPPPVNITIFGSFARGDATAESDIDVAAVIPDDLSSEDVLWADAMDRWRRSAERLLGNQVNIIEASVTEVRRRLATGSGVWADIVRDGIVIAGPPLTEL